MANKPKPTSRDPESLAFSAVEDALHAGLSEDAPSGRENTQRGGRGGGKPADRLLSAEKISRRTARSANDDRPGAGGLLYSLQSQSGSGPFWFALVASIVWGVGVGIMGILRFTSAFSSSEGILEFLRSPELSGLVAVLVLPILGFYALAFLMRRAQDLRIAANSMTQAAMRLAEPETTATRQITTVAQAVRREVNAIGDGLERALSRASEIEVMVHNEVNSLERSYSENESRMRILIDELSSQREAVFTNSEQVRDAISNAHRTFASDMQTVGVALAEQLNSISTDLSGRLTERSDQIIAALENMGGLVEGTLVEKTDAFSQIVEERAEALSTTLDARVGIINDALLARTGELNRTLNEGSTGLTSQFEQKSAMLANILRASGESVLGDLSLRADEIAERLTNIGGRLSTDIADKAGEANKSLAAIGDRFDEVFAIQANNLESRIQTALLELTGAVEDSTEKARTAFLDAGNDNISRLAIRAEEITGVLDERVGQMNEIVGEKGDKLINTLNHHQNAITHNAELLENALKERAENLNEVMTTHTAQVADTFSNSAENFQAKVDTSLRIVADTIDTRTNYLSDLIESKVTEVNANLGKGIDSAVTRITDAEQGVSAKFAQAAKAIEQSAGMLGETVDATVLRSTEALTANANTMATRMDEHLGEVEGRLDASVHRVMHAVDNKLGTLPESITSRVELAADRMTSLNELIAKTVTTTMAELEQGATSIEVLVRDKVTGLAGTLTSDVEQSAGRMEVVVSQALEQLGIAAQTVDELVGVRAPAAAKELTAKAEELHAIVDNQSESFTALVDSRTASITEAIATHTAQFNSVIDEKVSGMTGALVEQTATLESMVKTGTDSINATMEGHATRFSDLIKAGTTEVNDSLAERAAVFASIVEERTSQINTALTERSDSFSELVDTKSRAITEAFDNGTSGLTGLIEERTSALTNVLASQTGTFAELIDTRTANLEASLRSHGNILKAALELTANEAEELMSTSTQRITTEVTEALQKLNESNTLLQQVLDTATTNLAELESSVGRHTSNYAQTVMNAVSDTHEAGRLMGDHVGELRSAIGTLSEELETIKTALAAQTTGFSSAAKELSEAGLVTVSTLDSGRDAMETLVTGFASRADEIDERIKSFTASLTDSVSQAEDRIAISQRAMEDTVRTSAEQLNDNLRKVSETASAETERAGESLRKVQQELVAELQNAIKDAGERFQDSAQLMRGSAAEVAKDLEATREEIRRSVVDLPEETRASAAAMRRVVAEQIEALNELNAIVRAQPATHDLSNSRSHSGSTTRPTQRQSAPSRPAPEAPVTAAIAPPATTKPAPAEPAKPAPAPARNDANGADSGSDGWLRDLLRNASANQEASAGSGASPEGLGAMTADIGRAFDQKVLTESWQRYREGESGAFTRRVYTLAGQGIYDEVRKRVRRDEVFAEAANAFMIKFEEALNTATDGPNGIETSLQLLVSEQGKIYTMLSHASGRLD